MKLFGKEFKFNGYDIYHKGNLKNLNPTENVLSGDDLNDIKTTGFYYAGGSNKVTNKPSGVDAFGLLVMRSADGYYAQILYSANTSARKIFTRQYSASAWSTWVPVYSADNKPTASDVGAYSKAETYSKAEVDNKITSAQGAKTYVQETEPTDAASGSIWIS